MQQVIKFIVISVCWAIFSMPMTADAYVGPGLGLGALGAVLGVVFSIFLAIFAIFWYPIKRLFKRFRKETPKEY